MIYILFILAFLVRLIALNQSLWLDEATTARVLQQSNFWQIVSNFSPHDFHPPLYYLFMKLWTNIFGYSEIALRMPSVLFSLGVGWFVYLIGKKLKNKKVGLWAAALFLFNPLIVYYSQEARMYMMVTFLLIGALYFYLQLTGGGGGGTRQRGVNNVNEHWREETSDRTRQLLFFNLFVFLAFLTFYGSVFLIAAIYLYLLVKKQLRLLFLLLPGFVLALLLVSPLLYQQYLNSRQQLVLVANWKNVLGTANVKNLLLIPLKFSIGRISWEPKAVYYVVGGLWTTFVILSGTKNLIRSDPSHPFRMTLGVLFITPLILGVIFSFFSPLLQYFRFLYLIPLMALLIAIGTDKKWQKMVLLGGFAAFSLVYLLNPNFHREDWKSLAGSLPKDQKVQIISSSSDTLIYYRKDLKICDLKAKITPRGCDFGKKVFVIPYTTDIYGFNYKSKLQAGGFVQQKTQGFRGLTFEVWSKKAL